MDHRRNRETVTKLARKRQRELRCSLYLPFDVCSLTIYELPLICFDVQLNSASQHRVLVSAHTNLYLYLYVSCVCVLLYRFFFVSLCRYIVYRAHFLMLAIMMVMMVVRQKYEVRYTVGRVYCNLVHTAKSESQLCAF